MMLEEPNNFKSTVKNEQSKGKANISTTIKQLQSDLINDELITWNVVERSDSSSKVSRTYYSHRLNIETDETNFINFPESKI